MADCGTTARYRKGCRCKQCKAANTQAMRTYVAKRKERDGISMYVGRPRTRAVCSRPCANCDRQFTTRADSPQRFCSLNCAQRDRVRRQKQGRNQIVRYTGPSVRPPKPPPSPRQRKTTRKFKSGQCRVCSSWFISLNVDVTCSSECQIKKRRLDKDIGRARRTGAYVADVNRKQVFERDGYRCHLCRRKTNPDKQVPHPKAPTIDHVIPLANGGTHEPLNCRTACFQCNSRKSNRGSGDQLLLIA